ncbi:unnamed protein product, partial [Rotaria socialis]
MNTTIDSSLLSTQFTENLLSTANVEELRAKNQDKEVIESIYSYWFGENIDTWSKTYPLKTKLWFKADKKIDQEIKEKFEKFLIDATTENSKLCERWQTTSRGKLILIILFDQFSRNIYRGTRKMFEYDHFALKIALEIIDDSTHVTAYSLPERLFLYLPLVHSESLIYTAKGADLMNDLALQVTQRNLLDNDRTIELAAIFENPLVLSHPGGHFTPNAWPNTRIKQFLIAQQERLTHKQGATINNDINQFEALITFEEKLKATIFNHQKRISNLPTTERKNNKLPIIPIGLSKPIDQQNIEIIIEHIDDYLLDDVILLVWCERTTFYNSEPKEDNDKCATSLFFRHWILVYLKKPDELLSSHFHAILKYGGWGDLKTLYITTDQMLSEFAQEKTLLDNLKATCVKVFGDQLKHDYRVVLNQPDESENDREQENSIQNQEWIGNCAKEAPRISNTPTNSCTIMAKDIAKYMQPIVNADNKSEKQFNADKGYSYQTYKRLISSICHVLEKASPNFVAEQMRTRNRKDRAFQYTKEQREQLLKAPPSSYITNPEPEPVVPCSLEELEPLLEHLKLNRPGPHDDKQSIVFSRGTIMSGGRLDLCKQVVGPQGIQPLLNAMKQSSVINRLLLGNNIVGLPGAQAISQYIRCNTDSNIDTWYIAGNHFDSECISLICDALATDTKVKALWLKRNPILASGIVHIAQMLATNQYLQTLDLLNTGLLDEGCEILFNAFKSNHNLKHLYMDTNGLTVKSGHIIRLHFEQNDNHLESLYLSCNALGDA